jgi:hypothetical protein
MAEPRDNRTHEPSLRELTAELDGLRETGKVKYESVKEILEERHRLYTERLDSVKDNIKAAFNNSEKAFVKAEQNQKDYNIVHNDLSRQLDIQNKATMPRVEVESRFRMIEDRISEIREERGKDTGKSAGMNVVWGYAATIVTIIIGFLGIGIMIVFRNK